MVAWFAPKKEVTTEWVAFHMLQCATASEAVDAPIVEAIRRYASVSPDHARRELFFLRVLAADVGVKKALKHDEILVAKTHLGFVSFCDLVSPPDDCALPPYDVRSPEGRRSWMYYSVAFDAQLKGVEQDRALLLRSEGVARIGTFELLQRWQAYEAILKQSGIQAVAGAFAQRLTPSPPEEFHKIGSALLSHMIPSVRESLKGYRAYVTERGLDI